MCIIIYKPEGEKLPSDEILERCAKANSDGAGVMWRTSADNIRIERGTFDVAEMKKLLEGIDTVATEIAIHFRSATSGKKDTANSHPFPLNTKHIVTRTERQSVLAQGGFAHNGVLHSVWSKEELDEQSDTSLLIRDIIGALDLNSEALDNTLSVIACNTNSRFILMTDECTLLYGGYTEDDNILYSSSAYKPTKTVVATTKGFLKKDKDDDEDDEDKKPRLLLPGKDDKPLPVRIAELDKQLCPNCRGGIGVRYGNADNCYVCPECRHVFMVAIYRPETKIPIGMCHECHEAGTPISIEYWWCNKCHIFWGIDGRMYKYNK